MSDDKHAVTYSDGLSLTWISLCRDKSRSRFITFISMDKSVSTTIRGKGKCSLVKMYLTHE